MKLFIGTRQLPYQMRQRVRRQSMKDYRGGIGRDERPGFRTGRGGS